MPSKIIQSGPEPIDAKFTADELDLMASVRKWLETHIADYDSRSKHRALLAIASDLVDAATDVSAEARPGVKVVELGIWRNASRSSLVPLIKQPRTRCEALPVQEHCR